MTLLKQLFQQQQAGLTVYSPDCTHSRLWGHLDQTIQQATGFSVVRRQWLNHDINSVLRFYRGPNDDPPAEQDPVEALQKYHNIPPDKLQYGHLMVKMLITGPSLLTIWRGASAIPSLLKIKGKTQPAEAEAGSIRGSFWCDNGVCNLIHSSDDTDEALRELEAVGLSYWLNEEAESGLLINPTPNPTAYVAHSGIVTVSEVAKRMLLAANIQPLAFQLPASGDAKATNQHLTLHLQEIADSYLPLAPFIQAFLAGDLIAVTNLLKGLPVTPWEYFVIQCGVIGRDKWQA